MEKLGEVTIDNSLNVSITWQVDQHLLGKNFATIVNALKELQAAQLKQDGMIKDLLGLKEKVQQLGGSVERLEKNGANVTNNKEVVVNNQGAANLEADLMALTKRVDKNQTNTMENIKDINLINKELFDLKKLIEGLRNQISHSSNVQIDRQGKNNYEMHDIAENMSKELQLNSEKMKEMEARLIKAEEQLSKHDKDIKDLLERQDKNKGQSTAPSSKLDKDLEELKRDLRDKLEIINKKISNLQSDYDGHDQDINEIKDMLAEREENKQENTNEQANTQKEQTNISTLDFNALRRKVEDVDKRETRDVKNLLEEINNLRQELKNQAQRSEAKSSFEQESKSIKRAQTPKDDFNEKLNDLILKVSYLEKLMAGSKNSLNDDKNPEKLPTINRHRKRDANFTVYQEKDKSGISRKDLAELKAELEAWIKSLFDENKEKENFQELELKIQEIKRSLQRKADAEGTKKGFNFLENKITQLYLFLTEPDTEDAMIVRKGFNCLSCSKRVEKLRGRIGPKLNWNNMTTTNYSPPKVGYSKPMGESSIQKADD